MPRKIFVLDTNVLLTSPDALETFADNDIVIPLAVVEELEKFRTEPTGDRGYVARATLRLLGEVMDGNRSLVAEGRPLPLNNGGTVRIEMNEVDQAGLPESMRDRGNNDRRILAVAAGLTKSATQHVTLISRDLPMRLYAMQVGVDTQDYHHYQAARTDYTGIETVMAASSDIDRLYRDGSILLPEIDDMPVNTGLIIDTGGSQSALAVKGKDGLAHRINQGQDAFGVKGRSAEQRIALHHLLNRDVGVVTLGGQAGTGKTFLAIAAGLEAVLERRTHKRVMVFRNTHAVGGEDIGFLPGTEEEKMEPWARAIWDAVESFGSDLLMEEIRENRVLTVSPLTHLRGRTISDTFIIVDEGQNLDWMTHKTVLTRLGQDSKIVISYDVSQRDNHRVGRRDGIAKIVETLTGHPLFAHTTLVRSERSAVAAMASELLEDGR